MSPSDQIQGAFVRRAMGGPSIAPQQPAPAPDYSLQFGPAAPASMSEDLITALYHLIQAGPSYYPWREDTMPPDAKALDEVNVIGTPTVAAEKTA